MLGMPPPGTTSATDMTPRDRHNALSNTLGESLWGFQMAMVAPATVLTVLLRHYGSGERLIGSVGAIESGAVLLPQVLGVYLFTSRKRRKVHLVLWHVLLMSPMLLVMGVLARGPGGMSPRAVAIALLVCFGWFQTAMGVIVAVWLDWLAHLFGPAIRGRVFGISWCCSALAGTGGALAAGHVLETYPQPLAFSYLYMAASAMTVASMAAFCLMKDPAADAPADSPVAGTTGLLDSFKSSLGDRNFRAFIIGRIIATGGFCIGPFITVLLYVGGGRRLGREHGGIAGRGPDCRLQHRIPRPGADGRHHRPPARRDGGDRGPDGGTGRDARFGREDQLHDGVFRGRAGCRRRLPFPYEHAV